jgi:hypothetical protein
MFFEMEENVKNKKTKFLLLTLTLLSLASACKTASENTNSGNTNGATGQTNSRSAEATPAIETTPEALGKEWMANRADADRKYTGKTLSLTGEVHTAQQIGNQVIVDVVGVPFDAKTGGVNISCSDAPSQEARLLIEAIQTHDRMSQTQKDYKRPKYTATFKGVYERSAPPEKLDGFISLLPCKLSVLK